MVLSLLFRGGIMNIQKVCIIGAGNVGISLAVDISASSVKDIVLLTTKNELSSKEFTKIDSYCHYYKEDGTEGDLSPDTIVSMNMWGFKTDFFGYLEKDFLVFLDENINVPKSEFYLPIVVDKLIKNGTKNAAVLVAEDKWYGVTYKQDIDNVVSAVKSLCDEGKYNFK